jgi:hypothetical protein
VTEAVRQLVPGRSTQVDVEAEILRLSARLEEATDEYARLITLAAEAEVNFKRDHAKAVLRSTEGTVAQREAEAILTTVDALMQRKISEALAGAQKELAASLRCQLSALQTLAANIRAQV